MESPWKSWPVVVFGVLLLLYVLYLHIAIYRGLGDQSKLLNRLRDLIVGDFRLTFN